jgi:hypothetical protein
MTREAQSKECRNQRNTRKNLTKAEDYLTEVEKSQGAAKAWGLRQRLEHGEVNLKDLKGS